jgi:predicted PurR-regulated permease PerM
LLYSSKEIEKCLSQIIPLSATDLKQLADETNLMVRANALGIPIVSIVHGVVASIGYYFLGIDNWGLWGFLTGVFAFFPFVGIMIVWLPLAIYYYSINQNFTASGLALYSILVTGNVDYITRLGILKKMGNVHPMITVLGVIVGLKLFGFMGLIFGPLLISYFIILIKFYTKEFAASSIINKTVKEKELPA